MLLLQAMKHRRAHTATPCNTLHYTLTLQHTGGDAAVAGDEASQARGRQCCEHG